MLRRQKLRQPLEQLFRDLGVDCQMADRFPQVRPLDLHHHALPIRKPFLLCCFDRRQHLISLPVGERGRRTAILGTQETLDALGEVAAGGDVRVGRLAHRFI